MTWLRKPAFEFMADRRRIQAEIENVELTLRELENAVSRPERSPVELAGIATFVHNAYNGIENILKQILQAEKITVPRQSTWHKALLDQARSAGLVSEGMAEELLEYLAFRHFFVHGYGILLEETPLMDLATRLPGVWNRFQEETRRYREG